MNFFARRAGYYALALETGLANPEEVHEWAEATAMPVAELPALLVDLLVARYSPLRDLLSLLRSHSDDESREGAKLAILGRLSRETIAGRWTTPEAVDCLRQMQFRGDYAFSKALDDELECHMRDYILANEVPGIELDYPELDYHKVTDRLKEWLSRFETVEWDFLNTKNEATWIR